jgi:DUF971 family protein
VSIQPTALKSINADTIEIAWSDGAVRRYPVRDLRRDCPCASCREQRMAPPPPETSLTVLSPAQLQPLRIDKMEPVGRYAYSIHFSDGHDTGIYTLELLRELGESASSGP